MTKKIKLINLTPHPVTILDEDNNVVLTLPIAEKPARARVHNIREGEVETVEGVKIPLNGSKVHGETENLPESKEGVMFIVSLLVCRANPDRPDLLVVDELVRDQDGKILGARALSRNPYLKSDGVGNV